MKRATIVASVTIVLVGLIAGVGAAPPPRQQVHGWVKLPTPVVGGTRPAQDAPGCAPGIQRRLMLAAGEAPQGLFGFKFEIDERTWGTNFVLETTGSGSADFDILFYTDPDHIATLQPSYAGKPGRPGSLESGVVPTGSVEAVVCLAVGADATFLYEAGKGVKIPS